jgi:polysaccharide export outer membrane protein
MVSTWRQLCSVFCVASLVSGCGGLPKAPVYPSKKDGFSGPKQIVRPGLPNDPPPPLTLQPGDVLSIDLASEQPRTISGVVVDATGRVHLPMAGDIEVGGVGLTEAEARVQTALRKFDRFVQVTISMAEARGQRVTVLGAVVTQGSTQLAPGARVADVIASAGGPLTSAGAVEAPVWIADVGGAIVTRAGKPLPIDVAKALRGDRLHNVYVHPGDHIYVPPALGTNISILGQVGSPRVFAHRAGLRLTQALAMAGGVTVGADKGDIRVIRGTLEAPRVYRASLADIVAGDSHDVLLQAGDIIFVTDDPIEDIGEVMALIAPIVSLGFSGALIGVTLSRTTTPASSTTTTKP